MTSVVNMQSLVSGFPNNTMFASLFFSLLLLSLWEYIDSEFKELLVAIKIPNTIDCNSANVLR